MKFYYLLINLILYVHSLNNGLAKTPPMGWMSWGRYRCITDCKNRPSECIRYLFKRSSTTRLIRRSVLYFSENLFKTMSDKMISDGYADAGYEYVIVDDCWMEKERDENGNLVSDRERFPNGMESLSNYVKKSIFNTEAIYLLDLFQIHGLGLKFGIYGNYGEKTCEKYAGSKHHIADDVKLFVKWKADYLKLDGCFTQSEELDYGYPEFGRQLNKTGRPIVFSCSWPYYQEHIFKIKV
jgi:hypothetical protein